MTTEEEYQHPYNSRIIDVYIKLIKDRYSQINIDDILQYAGMEPYQIADQGHWFSQRQVDRFYKKLEELSGNPKIAREAGQYAASFQEGNSMRKYFLSMIGPAGAYERVSKTSPNLTRSTDFEFKKLSYNSVEFRVIPKKGMHEKPYQCENRIGLLEAISMVFNKKPPRIEHPECCFKGGKCCRYIITWEHSPLVLYRRLRNYLSLFLILANAAAPFFFPRLSLTLFLPVSAIFLLSIFLFIKYRETGDLKQRIEDVESATDDLIKQININYNNTLITHEIGQIINKQTTINEILQSCTNLFEKRLDFDRGGILLADPEKKYLIFRTAFGYVDEHIALLKQTAFHLDKPESRGIFVVCFREKKPFLINDVDEIKKDLSPRSLDFAKHLGSKSFICCPIISEDESLGILTVDNDHTNRPLVQSDMSLLMGISSVIGVAVENARLLEAREKQFHSLLKVMASSIDARDPLTAGHSEKVTEYAVAICNEMGLSEEYQEMIHTAALLHDYGKIAIPDKILKKNGPLTDTEFTIIKTHVVKTKEILNEINFEGKYSTIPEVAGSHHEKVNGSGYPGGVKGKEIPLGARIIAVADFFDAITSKRHYRKPMSFEEAVSVLKKAAGDHLDKKIVDIFIRYLYRTSGEENPHKETYSLGLLPRQEMRGV